MATETLRPNADGTYQDFNPKGGGAHYVEVDEVTADDFATYVSKWVGAAWDDEETFGLPNHSEGSGTINQVKVYVRAARDPADTAQMKVAVYTHSVLYMGDANDLGTVFAPISYQWDTNPNTGQPWTWDEIDALEAGLQTGNGNVTAYATQVYVEVDYTAVTPKTSSDAGSGVDAYVSLETPEAKLSSDTGSGVEGAPLPSATLTGSETGSGIEAFIARLLATVDTGGGVEASSVETEGLFKDLFATELGEGSDSLTAKIEMPTKGGGMKLWT